MQEVGNCKKPRVKRVFFSRIAFNSADRLQIPSRPVIVPCGRMSPPYFYLRSYDPGHGSVELDEDNSKHVLQVLRMKAKDRLQLTDGKGLVLLCELATVHKKKAQVAILNQRIEPRPSRRITIGISLLKNPGRFEWFLEKATEIGVSQIIPLVCAQTEKHFFRDSRMGAILVSAMLQSQQAWVPDLKEPTALKEVLAASKQQQRFIAHCAPGLPHLSDLINSTLDSQLILIGPEGDFTEDEIKMALEQNFTAVSLGISRLRTETAGLVAATLLNVS